MKTYLLNLGFAVLSAGTVGIIFAVAMEIQTAEPIYLIVMKIAAGLIGIGGGLMGMAALKKKK